MDDWDARKKPDRLDDAHLASLRDLVARLQTHEGPWGELAGGDRIGPNTITTPYMIKSDVTRAAMRWMYDTVRIIDFDWGQWDEGREIFRTWQPDTADGLDHLTVRKLITAIARNDRFNEGVWVEMFEEGFGVPLFARLLELEEALDV